MSRNPLVSVILSTFNRGELLKRSIPSVLDQTYENLKLIVVDDGSPDNTESVVRKFMDEDSRVSYLKHSNRGLALSRNAGLSRSSGEYFSVIDDDDMYSENHLEERVKYFLNKPDIDIVYGGLVPVGPEELQYVPDMKRPGETIHISECVVSGTLFGKMKVIRDVGGFRDVDFAEDFDFVERVRWRFNVVKVDFPTYLYYCDSPNRLCELYKGGGGDAIIEYRKQADY